MFNLRHFCQEIFANLQKEKVETDQLEKLLAIFKTVLGRHATIKKRYIQSHQVQFMNKLVQKAVIIRSRLHKKFLRNNTECNGSANKKTRNY